MPVSWKHIATFFALTILLLAIVPLLSALTGASMDFDAAGARATDKTGVQMTSNLLVVVRLAFAEPSLFLLILGSAVPSLAALAVCAWSGRSTLRDLIRRFMPAGPGTPWSQALRAYALLVVVLPICLVLAYGIRTLIPGPTVYTQPDDIYGPALILALLTAAFLDQGGVLEELGWRGFAQPAIQSRLTPLTAAIVVGLAWGLWHVPRDVVGGVIGRLGAAHYLFLYLPAFVAGTVAVSIAAAYFMNRTGGSLIPAIMVHGLTNDAPGLAGLANLNVALTPYHQMTKAIPLLALALLLIAISGKSLGRRPPPSV